MEVTNAKLIAGEGPTLKKQSSSQNNKMISKRSTIDYEQQEYHILHDSLRIIQTLYEMRFIEKISRPIEKRTKEEYVEKFAGRMQSLHNKLEKIKTEYTQKRNIQNMNTKQKSIHGSVTHQIIDWKKSIRTIQTRYIEVFYQGSFKFYKKLYQLNHFSYPLNPMNIQEWASFCLNKRGEQSCC